MFLKGPPDNSRNFCGNRTGCFERGCGKILAVFLVTKTEHMTWEVQPSLAVLVVTGLGVFKETVGHFQLC